MASYPKKIEYLGQTNLDYNCIVDVSFEGGSSSTTSFLGKDPVYAERLNGPRLDFGSKYNEVITPVVTFIKNNYSEFSLQETRAMLKWLSSPKTVQWLTFYDKDDTFIGTFLCHATNIEQQKNDAVTIGFKVTFTTTAPWAYSALKTATLTNSAATGTLSITNSSDEMYEYVYPHLEFESNVGIDSLRITNAATGESFVLNNLAQDEEITVDNENKIIYSNNSYRIIGNDFNLSWLRFAPGINNLTMEIDYTGSPDSVTNTLSLSWRERLKVGDI